HAPQRVVSHRGRVHGSHLTLGVPGVTMRAVVSQATVRVGSWCNSRKGGQPVLRGIVGRQEGNACRATRHRLGDVAEAVVSKILTPLVGRAIDAVHTRGAR